ncbi:MAG: PepSY domain-containing protein [Geodermatophilaceae bacterium]|nr:PepSY domain-containing protein [Geodermatophilaceae bacterium]MDQ3449633.1 hypothetical protein [Actinomycetota bacterium]
MRARTKIGIVGVTLLGAAAGGTGIATAAGGDDDDASGTAITGDALQQASSAALEFTGEGRVSGTEVGDEESYYEVEVTLDDGSQVDVQLDEGFTVVSSEAEDGNEAEGD